MKLRGLDPVGRWVVARYVRRWHGVCVQQRHAWRETDPEDSRGDLWLSRQESAGAMERWLRGEGP